MNQLPVQSSSMTGEQGRSEGYRLQLDGIRALAVALVFLGHYLKSLSHLLPSGGIGVRIFFVLSGFLITGILLSAIERSRGAGQPLSLTLKHFYIRRFYRIFPPYYLALLVAFAFNLNQWREYAIWLLGFAGNFYMAIHDKGMESYSPYWSVAVEEQFYLVWPFVLIAVPLRSIKWVCWSFILLGVGLRIGGVLLGVNSMAIYTSTPTAMDALALGALLAWYEYVGDWQGYERLCRWCVRLGLPVFLVLYGVAAFKSSAQFASALGLTPEILNNVFYIAGSLVGLWLIGRAAQDSKWWLRPVLLNPAVRYLGQISYGFYLYHMIVYGLAASAYATFGWSWDSYEPLRIIALTVISVVVSVVSYEYFEMPLAARKKYYPYVVKQGM